METMCGDGMHGAWRRRAPQRDDVGWQGRAACVPIALHCLCTAPASCPTSTARRPRCNPAGVAAAKLALAPSFVYGKAGEEDATTSSDDEEDWLLNH